MTVIVWDGKTLAADRRACFGTFHRSMKKILRLADGSLAGFAGDAAYCAQAIQWVNDGMVAADFPASQRSRETFAGLMIIKTDRTIWKLEDTPYPFQIQDHQFSTGSGRDYAMAAMHLGCSAVAAVEVACALDSSCGNGIDTLDFES